MPCSVNFTINTLFEITKPPPKPSKVLRKRLGFKTTVVSDPEFLAELEKRKEDDRQKEEKKERKNSPADKKRTEDQGPEEKTKIWAAFPK